MIRSEDRKVFPRKNWNIVFPILATRKCNERERENFSKGEEIKEKEENGETRGYTRGKEIVSMSSPIESVNDEIRALSPPVL